jgi:hypothetical protein
MAEKIGVFVSHHHSPEEDAFTARLVSDLEAAGADVWVDYQGISSGSFVRQINEGLSGRQWLVLVMTPGSLGSRWVQDEVYAALHMVNSERMRGVIPFVMTECDEALIPPLWAQLHRYDATKNYELARDALLRAIGMSLPPKEVTGQPSNQNAPVYRGHGDGTSNRIYFSSEDDMYSAMTQPGVKQEDLELDIARLKTLDGLKSLSHAEFIEAIALMLMATGYRQVERTRIYGGPALKCAAPDGETTFVACYNDLRSQPIVTATVEDALNNLHVDRTPFGDVSPEPKERAIIITIGWYTYEALELAKRHADKMTLIDGQQLVSMMQRVQPE